MNLWMVDNTLLDGLARIAARRPAWDWPAGTLQVSAKVWEEADQPNAAAPRHQLLRRVGSGGPWIARHDLALGSSAERFYSTYLRPQQANASKHEGEDQSIALCACELKTAIFVTGDAHAALVALAELGPGRVSTAFDLWADLAQQGLVSTSDLRELNEITARSKQGVFPGVPRRLASGA